MDATTVLELVVFAVSATTFAFAIWSLWNSHLDHQLLHHLQMNGIKRLTFRARVLRDVSRSACAGILCASSIVALHEPPDPHFLSMVLKVTVLIVSLLLGLAVYGDWRWRMDIDEALDELENRHG